MKKISVIILLFLLTMTATQVQALIRVSDDELDAGYDEDFQAYTDAVGIKDNVISAPISIFISSQTAKKVLENCSDHVKEETGKLNNGFYTDDSIWLGHVFKCKKCCGPLMKSVWRKYNRTMARLDPLVIFFNHGSSQVDIMYQIKLAKFYHKHSGKNFFLVGRASQTGATDVNQELSGKRASNVKRYFTEQGADSGSIEFRFFGEKPPRLNQAVIRLYGVNENEYGDIDVRGSTEEERQKYRLNQSVVVVAY